MAESFLTFAAIYCLWYGGAFLLTRAAGRRTGRDEALR